MKIESNYEHVNENEMQCKSPYNTDFNVEN